MGSTPGSMDSRASNTAASSSYSTTMDSSARWASSSDSAATAAMGSPTYLGLLVKTLQSL